MNFDKIAEGERGLLSELNDIVTGFLNKCASQEFELINLMDLATYASVSDFQTVTGDTLINNNNNKQT